MPSERGVALLEVLVALTILAVAGLSIASLVGARSRDLAELHEREIRMTRADGLLTRLVLRDRQGLDLRIGRRVDGPFVVDIQRPRPTLYRLAVADTFAPELPLLVTVVYRPEAP